MTSGETQTQNPPGEDADQEEVEEEEIENNIAMTCALEGNVERFIKCFEDEESPYKETVNDSINERGIDGKSPLDMAAMLGRLEMVKELITRGAEVNSATQKGYTALHLAGAWGKIECCKCLVDNAADIQLRTGQGERAREMALRYNQTECVDYLDWAEARQALQAAIQSMRDTLADPEKVQGRLTREDKNSTNNLCNEKTTWLENTTDATTHDFIVQKQEFESALIVIFQKLSEPLQSGRRSVLKSSASTRNTRNASPALSSARKTRKD